jgi:enterochelin esterase-like enzyme
MKRVLILLAGAVAAGVLVAAATHAGAAVQSGQRLDTSFRSSALGTSLRFEVYLPAGYATSGQRYPVVYFLHGLPAGPNAYHGASFVERALDRLDRSAILVAPQGSLQPQGDPEYLGRWEEAIARELPRVVDSRFRTVASRNGRALIGLSAGGYGAMLLALHHLDEFAVIESWSGYFHPTNPAGTAPLDLGSTTANARASAHTYVPTLKRTLKQKPTFIGFYVGSDDDRFRDENEQLDRELSEARVPHVFRLYPGGHDQTVWAKHAPAWLTLALDHLVPAR